MTVHYQIDNEVFANYIEKINPSDPILADIAAYNEHHPKGGMMMDPVQMQLLAWLANLMNTKYYLEIGVFTGYSSTAMGLRLPDDAQLYLCDISVSYTDIARNFWQKAGIDNKIQLYLQPALITLRALLEDDKKDFFDFVLIDADKAPLVDYIENTYPLVRQGGVIAIDNTYQKGKVVGQVKEDDSASLQVIRRFNQDIVKDSRFSS
ncbi:MAG: class I SAM-dependent methyltransferase, partial [Neisseriaceae bacterium]|nr:class I SAM-dependent methyltransferase [Neisseriaceae bacterium]